ncbi:hypothetical protein BGZ65_003632 [Modicella reniformis]|uniref:Uncharacterized protein n=1 Tax=Modicella reniformis TaxID=1440133 RepID=A0A9P6M977_9FUNG|nr:hypothetical protein BGZ65_003632 [Modicella reniformis]
MYSTSDHQEIGSEDVLFNTCFTSEHTTKNYAYVSFEPKNATINFYSDEACQEFAFGLIGIYGRYPGLARSYKWVGWTEDAIGFLFDKEPFQGQGDAAPGAVPLPPPDEEQNPGGEEGGVTPNHPTPMVDDTKVKDTLPYNRVEDESADRDGDILLLRTKDRSEHFELGNDDDDDDDDEDNNDGNDSDDSDSNVDKAHESSHPLQQQPQKQRERHGDRYQDDDDHVIAKVIEVVKNI